MLTDFQLYIRFSIDATAKVLDYIHNSSSSLDSSVNRFSLVTLRLPGALRGPF